MKLGMRWLLALVAVLALVLTACGDQADDEPAGDGGDTTAPADLGLQEDGRIVVGSDINFEPFEFMQDGEPAGFDIDLMNEIAERLGLEVEFVNTGFDGIFPALSQGQFDAIISAITITPERDENIDFSDPYFAANQGLAVTEGSEIASVDDLAGQDVAVQAGTTGEEYAENTFTDANIVAFPTSPEAFTALTSGQVDAVFIDLPVVAANVESREGVQQVQEVETGEEYGIGVPQGNDALREAINETLDEIIADGTYAEIYGTWFEGDVPEQFRTE